MVDLASATLSIAARPEAKPCCWVQSSSSRIFVCSSRAKLRKARYMKTSRQTHIPLRVSSILATFSCRVLLALAWISWIPAASAQEGQKPGETYLALVSAAKSSFEELNRYLSKAFLKEVEAQPKEERAEWFKYMKGLWNVTDLKITKESVSGKRCDLQATATNEAGKSATGNIELVKEGGGWKFVDHAWASQL